MVINEWQEKTYDVIWSWMHIQIHFLLLYLELSDTGKSGSPNLAKRIRRKNSSSSVVNPRNKSKLNAKRKHNSRTPTLRKIHLVVFWTLRKPEGDGRSDLQPRTAVKAHRWTDPLIRMILISRQKHLRTPNSTRTVRPDTVDGPTNTDGPILSYGQFNNFSRQNSRTPTDRASLAHEQQECATNSNLHE
jgi:hypothetical protein